MNYEDYIEQGLNGEAPLKLIMRGSIQNSGNEKVYSVPLDVDLTTLSHYPSIAISGDDLRD